MSHLILVLVFIVPMLLLIIKKRSEANALEKKRLPPGPKGLPLIGNLHQIGKFSDQTLRHLSYEYGPLIFLQLGSFSSIFVSSANIVKEIFKTNDLTFSGRPDLYAATKIFYDCSNITFAPYGDYWRKIRKIANVELLSTKRVQSFETIRQQELSLVINSITTTSSCGALVNVSELVISMTYNVIQRVVFGNKKNDGMRKFREIFHETQELLRMFNIGDIFPKLGWINKLNGVDARLHKTFKEFDIFFDEVIKEHMECQSKATSEQENFLDILLQHCECDDYQNQEYGLTKEQIKGVLMDMFLAGIDPSAMTIIWTMIELIKNPSAMKKAQDEIRRNFQDEKRLHIKENELSKLEYLKLVVKEVLRLHPPVPILVPRETIDCCTIQGYDIPAKTRVFINAKAISRDAEHWDNPMEFNPERFLNRCVDFKGQDFAFIPFGTGRRGCPGSNFAILFIELVLANLLHCFEWVLPPGVKAEDIDVNDTLATTMHKSAPLRLIALAK